MAPTIEQSRRKAEMPPSIGGNDYDNVQSVRPLINFGFGAADLLAIDRDNAVKLPPTLKA
jgi:hypothetical protein